MDYSYNDKQHGCYGTASSYYDEQVNHYLLHGNLGSFTNALYTAIFHADNDNLEKLRKGFPEEVKAVERYRAGDI